MSALKRVTPSPAVVSFKGAFKSGEIYGKSVFIWRRFVW